MTPLSLDDDMSLSLDDRNLEMNGNVSDVIPGFLRLEQTRIGM